MHSAKITIILPVLLCFLALAGCKDVEKENAIKEAAELKNKLEKTTVALKEAQNDKEALIAEMATITKALEKSNSELTVATQERNRLEEQVKQLQGSVEKLQNQIKKEAEDAVNSKLLGIVFTTNIGGEKSYPQNSLEEITINEKCLYVFCKWRLSVKDHTYAIRILDDSKQIVFERKYELKPKEPVWNTFPGYYINKHVDKPGRWTVEVYLDGRKMGEKSITVLGQHLQKINNTALCSYSSAADTHTWEKVEIKLTAENSYSNPYTDVEVWVRLKGPSFDKKVHGFWDGEKTFRVRMMATEPGTWTWTSHSNPVDAGLSGRSGRFKAISWTEAEKQANPNRRGTIRPTSNGRALQYADGTLFFLLCDTHWSAGTWRYPFKGRRLRTIISRGRALASRRRLVSSSRKDSTPSA